MVRPARVLAAVALASGALVLAAAPAGAGKFGPIVFDPNPVGAGGTTTATGSCLRSDFVTVTFVVTAGGTTVLLSDDFDVDETGAFSGSFDIPADAETQTVTADGECMQGVPGDSNLVDLLQGELSITAAPPPTTTTAATTTTTTTIAPTTTAAATTTPSTTLGPVTLPNTGSGSSSGATVAIGAGALALGMGLIVLARRRSADA